MTSVEDFCKKHNACKDCYKWGLKYETMERVFAEGDNSEYIIWFVTRKGVLTDRELRLFACFCARQNWHLLTDDRSKHAIEVAERYADGLATDDDLSAAWAAARDVAMAAARDVAWAATWAAARDAAMDASRAAAWAAANAASKDKDAAWASAQDAQIKWLRENTKPNFGAGLEESK
jgi:hypothetical protein